MTTNSLNNLGRMGNQAERYNEQSAIFNSARKTQ